jgi:hypothetical protein
MPKSGALAAPLSPAKVRALREAHGRALQLTEKHIQNGKKEESEFQRKPKPRNGIWCHAVPSPSFWTFTQGCKLTVSLIPCLSAKAVLLHFIQTNDKAYAPAQRDKGREHFWASPPFNAYFFASCIIFATRGSRPTQRPQSHRSFWRGSRCPAMPDAE